MTEKNELSISEALRRGREARGETLEQLQQKLGVSLTILQGIEAGDYDVVEPIYARLAIWHYAEHVGLGGDAMAARFEQEIGQLEEPVVMRADEPSPVPVASTSPVVTFLQRQPLNRLLGAALLFVASLVAAVALVRQSGSQTESYDRPDDYLSSPLSDTGDDATDESSAAPAGASAASQTQPPTDRTSQTPPAQVPVTQAPAPDSSEAQTPVRPTTTSTPSNQTPTTQAPETQDSATRNSATQNPSTQNPTTQAGDADEGSSSESASSLSDSDPSTAASSQQPVEPTPAAVVQVAPDTMTATPSVTTPPAGVETSLVAATQTPSLQDTTSAPSTRTEGDVILQVRAIDSTWVQVQWDGVDGIEEIIPKGEIRHWYADQFFMVCAGRAHGVHFHLQGVLLGDGRLGDATKVLRFRGLADGYQMLGPELEPLGAFTPLPPPEPAAESVDAEHP